MTTTSRLFRSKNDFDVMQMILRKDIPLPSSRVPGYPPDLEAVVMRALERDVDLRYQTARQLYEDLESVAFNQALVASPYVLGDYMRRLFPDEAEQSVFELDLQTGDTQITPAALVHRLSSPVLANLPLRAPTARADSVSETFVAMPPTRVATPRADQTDVDVDRPAVPGAATPERNWHEIGLIVSAVMIAVWLVWLFMRL